MVHSHPNSSSAGDARLEQVLAEYLQAEERGEPIDQQRLLAEHPDLAGDLASFFRNRAAMKQIAEQVQPHELSTTTFGAEAQLLSPLATPRFFGDYELLEEIGHGGMGVVYRARQSGTNRLVALKVIRPDRLAAFTPEERAAVLGRFRNEVQAAAKIEHDHVVTVFDVGEVDGQAYYTMRLIDGNSLSNRLRDGPLEPQVAAQYIEQVSRALVEAHRLGILHRDLKPHNILIESKNDRALLADFGLAKLTGGDQQLTVTAAVMGSPPYMSPEQALDAGKVDAVSDVYSLGATLYHLLTGRPPFLAASSAATLVQVQNTDPVRPALLNPAVPRDLETICLKCLEKRPALRYASAQEVADELRRFLDHEPIRARRPGIVERTARWARKRRAILSAAAVPVVIFLCVALTFVYLGYRRSRLDAQRYQLSVKANVPAYAEIYNADNELIVPRFSLPKLESLPLVPGDYRLLAWAPGTKPESIRFFAAPFATGAINVNLGQSQLWPPLVSSNRPESEILPVARQDGGNDLLRVRKDYRKPLLVERIDGKSGELQWRKTVDPGDYGCVTLPPADCDGDGVQDLVVCSIRGGIMVLRLDNGQIVLTHAPDLSGKPFAERWAYGPIPSLMVDVDGDQYLDLIQPGASRDEYGRAAAGISMRSLKSGEILWTSDLVSIENVAFGAHKDIPLIVGHRRDQDLDESLIALDGKSGTIAWTSKVTVQPDSPDHPFGRPTIVDLDRDGNKEVMQTFSHGLVVFALKDGDLQWQRTWPNRYFGLNHGREPEGLVPEVSDLGLELLVSVCGECVCLDRKTGRELWTQKIHRVLTTLRTEDIDGDGTAEWLVAEGYPGERKFPFWEDVKGVSITLRSGKDGEVLWRRDLPHTNDSVRGGNSPIAMAIWKDGRADDKIVICDKVNRKSGMSILSLRNGTMHFQSPGNFASPRLADLDGDGTEELYGLHSEFETTSLFAWRHDLPTWTIHTGDAAVLHDFDLDGIGDLLVDEESTLRAFSGRDGTTLWTSDRRVPYRLDSLLVPTIAPPLHDLNNDGIADVLLLTEFDNFYFPSNNLQTAAIALSGKDGRSLWTVSASVLVPWPSFTRHRWRTLEPEIREHAEVNVLVLTWASVGEIEYTPKPEFFVAQVGIRLDTGALVFRRCEPVAEAKDAEFQLPNTPGKLVQRLDKRSAYFLDPAGMTIFGETSEKRSFMAPGDPSFRFEYGRNRFRNAWLDETKIHANSPRAVASRSERSILRRELPWRRWHPTDLLRCSFISVVAILLPALGAYGAARFSGHFLRHKSNFNLSFRLTIATVVAIGVAILLVKGVSVFLSLTDDLSDYYFLGADLFAIHGLWSALIGVPIGTFFALLAWRAVRYDVRKATTMIASALVVTSAVCTLLLLFDIQWGGYIWRGWYEILYLGIFLTGVWIHLSWLVSGVRWVFVRKPSIRNSAARSPRFYPRPDGVWEEI